MVLVGRVPRRSAPASQEPTERRCHARNSEGQAYDDAARRPCGKSFEIVVSQVPVFRVHACKKRSMRVTAGSRGVFHRQTDAHDRRLRFRSLGGRMNYYSKSYAVFGRHRERERKDSCLNQRLAANEGGLS